MYLGLHVKCLTYFPDFNTNLDSTDIRKSCQYKISQNSIWGEPRWYMRTDAKDMAQLIGAFRDCAKALKKL